MRFPVSTIFFLVVAFIMFVGFATMSYVLWQVDLGLATGADAMLSASSKASFDGEVSLLRNAFGLASVGLLVIAVVCYVVDCLRDEPEYYWRP